MTDEDKQLIALLQGDTGAPKVDMGPGARAQRDTSSMRPAVAPDDVAPGDVRGDYGKHDVRRTIQGVNDQITTPEAHQAQKERSQAEDPIKNDPLAGQVLQGVVAGGAAKLAAPIAGPLLSRMIGGAVATPDHPIAGAAVGALPALPGAARAADNALGEAALNRVTAPAAAEGAHTLSKVIGGAVGTVVGHKIGGAPGAVAGAVVGSQARDLVARGTNALAQRLAERHMARMAAMRAAAGNAAAVPIHVPEEITVPEKYVPIQQTADQKVAELEATAPFKDSAPSQPSTLLRPPMSLEDKLSASVEIMGDLRVAQKTGTMTPELIQKALDAGISPTAVYHVVGNKVAANAALKKAITGE